MKRLGFFLASTALLALPGLARANAADAFGAGIEGHAMAGARTALESNGAAAYANPAGLATATATRLDLSLSDFGSSLNYNGGNAGSDSFAGIELGMVLPLPGLLKNAAIGVYGMFPSDDLGRVIARDADSPTFLQAGQLHRFLLYGALAYKIGPVSLGAGVQVLNSASGSLTLGTNLAQATVGQGTLSLDLVPTIAPVFGVSIDALDVLRIGASFRGAGDIEVELPSNTQLGPLNLQLALDALTYYRPPTWSAGVAYHDKLFSADLDVSYLQWSQAPNLGLSTTLITTSSLLPTLATSPSGLTLRDTPVFRLGGGIALLPNLTLMAGYAYVPTPVPSQVGPTNLLDNDRHELTAGLVLSFPDMLGLSSGPMSLGLAGQYQAMVTRTVLKTDPLDPYGDAVFGGSLFSLTAALTVRFGATP